jgi:membrane protease subunit (stomatin/prohibitin family)
MGLFDWLSGQFIEVIEWVDDSHDTMVYRFPTYNREIKYGAKLTVRESQVAVFVNEGVVADVLGPGIYELETKNLPILTSLQHWDHGFNSPFKAEVYFINTKRFTNLKWGTRNPIMVRDPEFSMVRLRAFGTYEIRIVDPKLFMTEIVGTDGHFTIDEIDEQLRNLIVSNFATVLGKSKIPILDLVSNYDNFSKFITQNIAPQFREYGLELTKVLIENISLPENVEKALDERTSREVTGDLDDNLKYQAGKALKEGKGPISDLIGMQVGFSFAKEMMEDKKEKKEEAPSKSQANDMPPPLPTQKIVKYYVAIDGESKGPFKLEEIEKMIVDGVIKRDTLMWKKGLDNWTKAEELIKEQFNQVPPPLPPS